MQNFDNLGLPMVVQFITAIKVRLDKPYCDLVMLLIPQSNNAAHKVWLCLARGDLVTYESRLHLLDMLLYLCKKWSGAFSGGARHSLRKQVADLPSLYLMSCLYAHCSVPKDMHVSWGSRPI